MRILCVMDSVSRLNGGIFEAERNLQKELARLPDCQIQVVGLHDEFSEAELPDWAPLVPVTCVVRGPRAFGYSPEMTRLLLESKGDLAYCAGLWKFHSLASLQWAKATGRPMVVAPHGMLDAWALSNAKLKKTVAGWVYQNAQLRRSRCLRALCRSEAESVRAYGLRNPVCIIPNGVSLPDLRYESTVTNKFRLHLVKKNGEKVLLYLGRLHPKKGIENLLKSWGVIRSANSSRPSQWSLAIAGWNQGHYEKELRRQVAERGIEESVSFLGPQFKEEKAACYRGCDAVILPSFSEGTPMVVLEAWSYGKPVLMTPQCNVPEGFAAGAGIRIETTPESISQGLGTLFEMSDADRQAMGQRGLKLVSQSFIWQKVASQMLDLFTWVTHGGVKPSTVEFL